MEAHPELPLIYVLDRTLITSRLVAMNYEDLTVVADRTFDHGFCQYLDVGDAGQGPRVYVSRLDDGISVLDPLTLELVEHVTMGHGTGSVAVMDDGQVAVSLGIGSFGIVPTRILQAGTWQELGGGGHYDWTHLEYVPGTSSLIEVGMGTSPATLSQYDWDPGSGELTWNYIDVPAGGFIYHKIFRVDPTGTYFVTHAYGSVYEATADGTYVGNLPRGEDYLYDYAFSPDGSVIHAAVSNRKHVRSFTYPGLTPTTGAALRGYPSRLVRVGDLLVALSRPEVDAEQVGLDVVRVGTP